MVQLGVDMDTMALEVLLFWLNPVQFEQLLEYLAMDRVRRWATILIAGALFFRLARSFWRHMRWRPLCRCRLPYGFRS
jgi:hypothetical protein